MIKKKHLLVVGIILPLILFSSCANNPDKEAQGNASETVEEPQVVKLTPIQEKIQKRLVNRISRLAVTQLNGEDVANITTDIASIVTKRPKELLPLLSYYEYYNDKLGIHLGQKDWTKLSFYKSIDGGAGSSFYDTNYKFYLHNDEAIFSWFLSAVSEGGKRGWIS